MPDDLMELGRDAAAALGLGREAAALAVLLVLGLGWWMRARRSATTQAIEALEATLAQQRTEIERLAVRMVAATEAEERCLARVRLMRADLHELRNAMQRAGMALPPLPSELAGAAD